LFELMAQSGEYRRTLFDRHGPNGAVPALWYGVDCTPPGRSVI
jgi:hypothetical protein